MTLRLYPGRPHPFLEQKSKKSSTGMGRGAIVFVITLLGLFVVVLYVVPTLMEDMVFPDIGIPFPTLFLILLGITIFVSAILMFRPGTHAGNRIARRVRDPTACQRVIKDGYEGLEVIISGPREATFGQVCRENWLFKNIEQKSNWFIRDDQGNDVTDTSLETVDGIFILVPEFGKEAQKEETDESNEFSSIHDSVEYYD